jgi:hypothetical protein
MGTKARPAQLRPPAGVQQWQAEQARKASRARTAASGGAGRAKRQIARDARRLAGAVADWDIAHRAGTALTPDMRDGIALALRSYASQVLAGAAPLGLAYEEVEAHVLAALDASRGRGVA